eukprot:COSAG06_NODE_12879_length_1317_cov_1.055008_2_plen_64_part_00
MSAIDVSNQLQDSEHQSALTTIGQNQIQETALEGKETMEGLRDDFSKGGTKSAQTIAPRQPNG